MHHEGLVELVVVERGARAELDVDHRAPWRRLRASCAWTARRRWWGGRACRLGRPWRSGPVDLVELGVGIPGLVEVDAGDGFRELGDDAVDVVAESVVGGVGDDGVGRVLVGDAVGEGALVDDAADELGAEALDGDKADHAVAVARGLHVDGARAGDGEGVADGLVAVGVGEDDVVLRDDSVADDLVGGGGAAEDVEGPVGAEDACGVALGFAWRSEMIEPGAERRGGDAEVGAEEIFAEEAWNSMPTGCLR